MENTLFWLRQNKSFLECPSDTLKRMMQFFACLAPQMVCEGTDLMCNAWALLVVVRGAGEVSWMEKHCWVLFCVSLGTVMLQVNECPMRPVSMNGSQVHLCCVRPTVCSPWPLASCLLHVLELST